MLVACLTACLKVSMQSAGTPLWLHMPPGCILPESCPEQAVYPGLAGQCLHCPLAAKTSGPTWSAGPQGLPKPVLLGRGPSHMLRGSSLATGSQLLA